MKKTILKLVLGTPIAITPIIGVVSCRTSWIKWERNDNPSNLKFSFQSDKSPEEMWVTRHLNTLMKAWDKNNETIDLEKLNNQFEFIKLFFAITNAKPDQPLIEYSNVENWVSFKKYIDDMKFSRNIKIKYKNRVKELNTIDINKQLNIISEKMKEGISALENSIIAKIFADQIVKQYSINVNVFDKKKQELVNKITRQINNNFGSIDINWIKNFIEAIENKNLKKVLHQKLKKLIYKCKEDFKTLALLKQELKEQYYSNQKNIDVLNSCLNNISAVPIQKTDGKITIETFAAKLIDVIDSTKNFLKIESIKQFTNESVDQAMNLGFLTNLPRGAFKKFETFVHTLDIFISQLFDDTSAFKPWSKEFNLLLNNSGSIKPRTIQQITYSSLEEVAEKSLKSEFIKEMISKRK